MKNKLLVTAFLLLAHALVFSATHKPDTVKAGIYVTSIHNVDFKQKEYSINLWLWLKYKRLDFDFEKNLEVPMAKSFEKSYVSTDTLEDGSIYMLMKLQCVMKDNWQINNYPFDRQKLRFAIENSNFDSKELVFTCDTAGSHYEKFFLTDRQQDDFVIKTEPRHYATSFGDPALKEPRSEYSTYKATLSVHRHSWELFFKLFLGMYLAFFISLACFYIHPDNMDSRLALSVGSLFAVIGNKYIIDSTLPETNSFTLVDTLHAITLFYIFLVMAVSVFTLNLIKNNKEQLAEKWNRIIGNTTLIMYVALNFWLIWRAYNSAGS